MIKHETRAADAALVLVHYHPHFRLHPVALGQHRDEIRVLPRNEVRVSPNAEGGAAHSDLRHGTIAPQRICFA